VTNLSDLCHNNCMLRVWLLRLNIVLGLLLWFVQPSFALDYDVIVVGAGSGGSAAAIQASRMGYSVALIEETDWVGGQMTTGGVPNMDEAFPAIRNTGLYQEFTQKIKAHYGDRPVGTCYWVSTSFCFEPQVGHLILKQMIKDANVTLMLNTTVEQVLQSGTTVNGVIIKKGDVEQSISSRYVIDATEYGDLLPLVSGLTYRIGYGTSDDPKPDACIQDITYTATFRRYSSTPPPEATFSKPPPSPAPNVKDLFTRLVNNSMDPKRYTVYPESWPVHVSYRGIPDSSRGPEGYYTAAQEDRLNMSHTMLNWANDFPATQSASHPTGMLSANYLTDKQFRRAVNCEAKLRTLQFMYYAQQELGFTNWGINTNQGYNTPYNLNQNQCDNIPLEFKAMEAHFPLIPYVRESLRLVGEYTLVAKDIYRTKDKPIPPVNFTDSLAVASYPIDLHNCYVLEAELESLADKPSGFSGAPFQIPMSTFYTSSVNGFLVAEKNISQSRMVNGASRLQPSTMLIGQAAGALAAVSIKTGQAPKTLDPTLVQIELLRSNVDISRFSYIGEYKDVKRTDWFWTGVQMVTTKGIMFGNDETKYFGVGDSVTRALMADILMRSYPYRFPQNTVLTPSFADVPVTHPFFNQIETIYAAKITAGCGFDSAGNRLYCPDANLTRAQAALFIAKSLYIDHDPQTGQIFTDVPSTHYAYHAINQLYKNKIISGCSTTPLSFCPDHGLTRAQIATIITNSLVFGATRNLNPPPINSADANQDGNIDQFDYLIWRKEYQQMTLGQTYAGDFNHNQFVDGLDYMIWHNQSSQ
jgi:hypothetical protein